MDALTIEQVEGLFGRQPGWCVSLYLPTHRAGKEIRQDPIRLKNRISEAEAQLEQAGFPGGEIKRLVEPARSLCDMDNEEHRKFWRHQADGLAMFLDEQGGFEHYRIPERFPELTVVAHRFHVKPLLRAVQQDDQYCLLAVSQNDVRFLEGSRTGLSARPVEDLPESLREVVRGEHHKGFYLHSFRVRARAEDTAVPHGHVESNEEHDLKRYFNIISEALDDVLKHDKRPLVFAGVDELFPYFRDATENANLVDESVSGNPDDLSDDQLHEKAWPLVERILQNRRKEVLQRYQAAAHTDLGGDDLEQIVIAAHDGRVETLLMQLGRHHWGTFDAESRRINRAEEASAENYDLCDLAAVRTLRADGQVVVLDEDADPVSEQGIAAIYRYPAAE